MTSKNVTTKTCSKCKQEKSIAEFHKHKSRKDGLKCCCKECNCSDRINYSHTKPGLITRIYNSQSDRSKVRNHNPPSYTKSELSSWLLNQKKFHELYLYWNKSGFDKMLVPSCDRINDYLPYTLDNIQLMTWRDNMYKHYADKINGINNKQSKSVMQFTRDGVLIKEYYSMRQASRETGIKYALIMDYCHMRKKETGSFLWYFS